MFEMKEIRLPRRRRRTIETIKKWEIHTHARTNIK
jgi:hypothetical protein